jgi:hypothetical protein
MDLVSPESDAKLQISGSLLASDRWPFIQEGRYIFRPNLQRVLEIAAAHDQLPIAFEYGQGRYALIQRNLVALRDVEILIVLTDIDVDNLVILPDERGDLPGAKCGVENVAVITPISPKDHDHAFMITPCGGQGRCKLRLGFLWGWI